jgi:3-dehydroquinate dehydratase-1
MAKKKPAAVSRPVIVAAVTTPINLRIALTRLPHAIDFLEIRADCWACDPGSILTAIPKLKKPLIVTTRHPKEGGANNLTKRDRLHLFEQFLPFATMIDIEERSLRDLRPIILKARALRLPLIVSYHDFKGAPSPAKMRKLVRSAEAAGAGIFKMAVTPRNAADLANMIRLLGSKQNVLIAMMGMGPLGKLSRIVCGTLGSALNYAYLDKAHVPGQWAADLLRERLDELVDPVP